MQLTSPDIKSYIIDIRFKLGCDERERQLGYVDIGYMWDRLQVCIKAQYQL